MKKVSFDFDNTLSKESVQKYALELIEEGYEIVITTTRYEKCEDYLLKNPECHKDLFSVAEKLNISKEKIFFTNMEYKWKSLLNMNDILFHLDDADFELRRISQFTGIPAISVMSSNWRNKCDKILNRKKNEKNMAH